MTSDAELTSYFAAPPGDRWVGITPMPMAKGGKLMVQFTTVSLQQRWSPDNVGAVWIEDSMEHYVKTLQLWAGVRRKSLYKFGKRACQMPEVDVVTSATLPTAGQHQVTWSGKDLKGNIVPDGMYTLFIEVSETELDVGATAMFPFAKGPMAPPLQPMDATPVKGVTITYTPMP
jgi:hypothetical protein